jgi:hypothetical protein
MPQLPSLLPWVALRDGAFLSLPDGEVHHRVIIPDDDIAHRVSTGSMLFLVNRNEGCSLLNPLSRETTAPRIVDLEGPCNLPLGILLNVNSIRKAVVLSDHVTAVQTQTGNSVYPTNLTISVCRPHSSTMLWQRPLDPDFNYILDIALFQEKLYVLATTRVGPYPLRL